jgi:hypothetical protein
VTDELAVRLDADWLLAIDLDPAGVAELNLGQLAVGASVEHGQAPDTQRAADVTDRDDVEATIIGLRLGRDPHPTAKVGPVGDGHGTDTTVEDRPVVQAKLNEGVLMRQQADHGAAQKVDRPTHDRGSASSAPDNLGTDPGIRHIDEIAPPGRGSDATDVDQAPAISPKPRGHVLCPARASQGAPQIGAGPALQESDPGRARARSAKEAIDDFVGRPVTADRDHQSIARLGGVVGRIAPLFGFDHLEGQAGAGFRTTSPETAGPTATGRGVDDD